MHPCQLPLSVWVRIVPEETPLSFYPLRTSSRNFNTRQGRGQRAIYQHIQGTQRYDNRPDLTEREYKTSTAPTVADTFGNDVGSCRFRSHRRNDDAPRSDASHTFWAMDALRFAGRLSVHRAVRDFDCWGRDFEFDGSTLRLSFDPGVWSWFYGCGRRRTGPSELDRRSGCSLRLWFWLGLD